MIFHVGIGIGWNGNNLKMMFPGDPDETVLTYDLQKINNSIRKISIHLTITQSTKSERLCSTSHPFIVVFSDYACFIVKIFNTEETTLKLEVVL